MALIEWTADLTLGIKEIDNQHRRLVAMINDLHDAMRQGKGKEVLGKIIDGLAAYTETHFKTEEKYFDQFAYPKAYTHKSEHNNFVQKVTEFRAGFSEGKFGLSTEVMNYLSDWLKNHIRGSDREYLPVFKSNGLQ